MATARLIPSTTAVSNSSYMTSANVDNMYTNTDSTTSGTFTHTRASTSYTYYGYIGGFNFSSIPSTAQVSSFTVKIKASATGHTTSTSTSYQMSLYNNTTAISNTYASGRLSTTTTTFTFSNGSLSWSTIVGYGDNFRIRIPLRRASSSTSDVVTVYGAEILVEYTAEDVHPTAVSLSQTTKTIEAGQSFTLIPTITPSNATNQNVTWSTSNSSVATVNNGVVTGVGAGSATITVTTVDGNKTATCSVTVTPVVLTDYVLTETIQQGKEYIIASGNSGNVYMMSNESGGSRQLVGVAATVTNNKISISSTTADRVLFTYQRYTSSNAVTATFSKNGAYLYTDSATGLRMNTPSTLDRFWHYSSERDLIWQFKSTSSDGYTDTSSEYKYYLELNSSNNFTDNHITSPAIADQTSLPKIYLFVQSSGTVEGDKVYKKVNGSWVLYGQLYKKTNGSWVAASDYAGAFDSGVKYKS